MLVVIALTTVVDGSHSGCPATKNTRFLVRPGNAAFNVTANPDAVFPEYPSVKVSDVSLATLATVQTIGATTSNIVSASPGNTCDRNDVPDPVTVVLAPVAVTVASVLAIAD